MTYVLSLVIVSESRLYRIFFTAAPYRYLQAHARPPTLTLIKTDEQATTTNEPQPLSKRGLSLESAFLGMVQ